MKSKTYTQSKRPFDKNQSSKFCQSGVKETHFQNLKEKRKWFFWSQGHFNNPIVCRLGNSCRSNEIVIPPNSNTFSDWRRTCHVSLVKTSWRPRANKTSWRPRATTTWTFDSHVIRSCTFKTAANLYASRRQANNFYLCIVLFWVGRYNKTLNDWPLGKQWVLFPLYLNVSLGFASGNIEGLGETKLTVSLGASH